MRATLTIAICAVCFMITNIPVAYVLVLARFYVSCILLYFQYDLSSRSGRRHGFHRPDIDLRWIAGGRRGRIARWKRVR
ncbi:hypothetical protein BV20DRAFT_499782 [Pilatotrama ljubarskyi]|nr:hypothetical protein BV20DRAFT_499782 [Pilatotrama ljubarskyi]